MTIIQILLLIMVGLAAGLLGGTLGVGGGIVVIPALIFLFGLSQHTAQGTTLAFMLPPVTFLATWTYWKNGNVNWRYALILSVTFLVGAYLGSIWAAHIPDKILRKAFGVLLLFIALKIIFSK
ncbi:sulfite exporter TauE/SafE family protein [Mangrovibacterium lignilyticum]|uniref:sulfite exporter TauE/SafE family protein n=1 Tax=Mangrovibacterium lignilyticum TaxID=2668052 RepID=UPI0013D899BB|nr:sulfite exporter TauE/SafE family protein [Mangrovibacterium lignilyticum]